MAKVPGTASQIILSRETSFAILLSSIVFAKSAFYSIHNSDVCLGVRSWY